MQGFGGLLQSVLRSIATCVAVTGGFSGRVFAAALLLVCPTASLAAPDGRVTIASHAPIVTGWFDTRDFPGGLISFMVTYALHDALVKPMPGNTFAPSLASKWTRSPDGLTYEFTLRPNLVFSNGDPITSEDVKFSFERYKGANAALLKSYVASFETPDALTARIRLKQPWPDFMLYYAGLTSAAGWVMPKNYITRVGDDEFLKRPVGAGPYGVKSFEGGIELVLEANEKFWRKTPAVKTVVMRVVPDELTRAAMIRNGESDISYVVRGAQGQTLGKTPGISLVAPKIPFMLWLMFAQQWDPQSPWSKKAVREAVQYAVNKKAIADAEYLGAGAPVGSIVPPTYEYAKPMPSPPYDPAKAKKLLADAGYPNGFDGGDFFVEGSYSSVGEAVVNDLQAVGVRLRMRVMDRAPFYLAWREKKLPGVIFAVSGTVDNAGTFLDQYVTTQGARSSGTYPGMDDLMKRQASEVDPAKRKEMLDKVQDMARDEFMFLPLLHAATTTAYGPRMAEPALGLIEDFTYVAPLEELRLK